MPWPLSSARSRSRPASSAIDTSALALDDNISDRRGASLDLSRSGLSPLSAVQESSKRDRRSSFPHLAIPSWRSTARSPGHNEEDGDVELVSGHATPFSATGLKGGFVPDEGQLSSRGSSIRSGSIRSSYYNGDEQDDEEEGSLRTGGSSRTRVMVSPFLTPVDSGWSEFGPDSIVPEELDRPKSTPASKSSDLYANAAPEASSKDQDVPTASKRRSRGWFSFSSTANGASTPTIEETKTLSIEPIPAARTISTHPSGQIANASDSLDSKAAGNKVNTATKSKFTFPSRRRGNSELSLKNMDE